MSLFRILKGDSSRISTDVTPFHDGYAYFTPDDGGFYIDAEVGGAQVRKRVSDPPSNKSELDKIATGDKAKWDAAEAKAHEHANKAVLDVVTADKVTKWDSGINQSDADSRYVKLNGDSSIVSLDGATIHFGKSGNTGVPFSVADENSPDTTCVFINTAGLIQFYPPYMDFTGNDGSFSFFGSDCMGIGGFGISSINGDKTVINVARGATDPDTRLYIQGSTEIDWVTLVGIRTTEDATDATEYINQRRFSASVGYVRDAINKMGSVCVNAILSAANWSNGTQSVDVAGMTEGGNGYVGVQENITKEQMDAICAAQLHVTAQGNGTITVTAFGEEPTVDIPIAVTILK